ncbi:hypothetical protein [Sutcliffiella halmapala]|uniref:hypothetical protein n=1 Tax=Sutcliffiella halmapala TaxID=79882 RepID=UPI00099578D6|nr:hypothetical protein [Sutcliffiella halmapala]
MEYQLKCKESAYPCEVTIDEDNNRFTIRKADSSGEFFNSPEELVYWILENWDSSDFNDEGEFQEMVKEIQLYFPINN